MTAVGVVLVWHREHSAKIDQHRIIDRFSGSKCTNAKKLRYQPYSDVLG
jgi:hypothetical protein